MQNDRIRGTVKVVEASAGEETTVVQSCEEERGRLHGCERDGDGCAEQSWMREI